MDNKCPGCTAEVDPNISLYCDGCTRPMHYSCLALPADAAAASDRARRMSSQVKIVCADCDNSFRSLVLHSGSIEEVLTEKLRNLIKGECDEFISEIKSLRREIDVLKESNIDLIKLLTSGNGGTVAPEKSLLSNNSSYASKVAVDKKIIVKPKNSVQSVLKTRSDVLNNCNILGEEIGITKVKSVSSGGLIISCKNENDGKKLKQIASVNLAENYDISEVNSFHPKIRIVGVTGDISESSFLSYLRKQNPDLIHESSFTKLIRFWPTRSNKDIFQADLEVDSATYNLLLKSGHILIGLNPCSVYDAVKIPRCYNCNGYFHTKKQCKRQLTCPLCADRHTIKDCTLYKCNSETIDKKRCINCQSMRNRPDNLNINHAAWEYNECESYKMALQRFKNDLFRDFSENYNFCRN